MKGMIMDISNGEKVLVYWRTKDDDAIAHIRKYFNLPNYTTLNGWTPGKIQRKDMAMFEECARRGFFHFRRKEWTYNGVTYSW